MPDVPTRNAAISRDERQSMYDDIEDALRGVFVSANDRTIAIRRARVALARLGALLEAVDG